MQHSVINNPTKRTKLEVKKCIKNGKTDKQEDKWNANGGSEK